MKLFAINDTTVLLSSRFIVVKVAVYCLEYKNEKLAADM